MTLNEFLKATGNQTREQQQSNRKLFQEMQARGELKLDPEPVNTSSLGFRLALRLMPGNMEMFRLATRSGSKVTFFYNDSDGLRQKMAQEINQAFEDHVRDLEDLIRRDEREKCAITAAGVGNDQWSVGDAWSSPGAMRKNIVRAICRRGLSVDQVAARCEACDEGECAKTAKVDVVA